MKRLIAFSAAYPDYGDPQDLMQKFRPISKSLLPAPFDWIAIPNRGYSIAKYPVTNAQYRKFIEAGGYNTERWWTNDGWQQKQKDSWTEPRFWQDSKWNGDTQPVIGVSWFEAVAFCLWLSESTGEKIMLPTEDQWQYAAQSDDGRTYPWGNNWNRELCNNNVEKKGIGKTTPVTQYEGKGDSPFGVVDMAGNVWEWCLTDYDEKTNDINSSANRRVLRGGSWNYVDTDYFRCDFRNDRDPRSRNDYNGFRLSRS
ncbi:MAG: SUMF1/EgtB/PvdO family nonheme iron enzyme [Chloroflexota bacterium]